MLSSFDASTLTLRAINFLPIDIMRWSRCDNLSVLIGFCLTPPLDDIREMINKLPDDQQS